MQNTTEAQNTELNDIKGKDNNHVDKPLAIPLL
jgi:hypothetical protein